MRITLPSALLLAAAPLAAQTAVTRDPHSFSRPDEIAIRHLELELTVDFETRRLTGAAILTLDRRAPAASELVLDVRDLDVTAVRLDGADAAATFALGEPAEFLGQSLTVPVTSETRTVRVEYRTRPEAAALQWLEPAQTAGGRRPFLFTQSQAILARTWVPCQDTPTVRMTYSATVRVPADLMAVMSAENPNTRSADGVYRFRMDQPIPSYLLALGVGDLAFHELGKRSGVYAEPAVVDGAAWELADTERMIAAAEKLYGPYRWGRYDLLVLPPSFPYGGMENPRLTFATPTILAGDKSLVALVAHELAHSWSGNLVTNATWNDFWLNEGFTTYFESRIMEEVYGVEHSEMLAQLSLAELERFLATLPADSRDTWLHGNLAGRDPDEGAGPIAYEKGMFFLRTLERAAGRERFDAFLRGYFEAHAFRSMTTAGFVEYARAHLYAQEPSLAERAPIDAWIYGPGLPKGVARAASPALAKVDRELERFRGGATAAELATQGWVTQQWLHFLGGLPADLPLERLAELDAAFGFTRSGNAAIFSAWAQGAITRGYLPVRPALAEFLQRVGRRLFLRPLYSELAKTPEGLAWAREVYARARPGYHAVSRGTIDAILGWTPAGS